MDNIFSIIMTVPTLGDYSPGYRENCMDVKF